MILKTLKASASTFARKFSRLSNDRLHRPALDVSEMNRIHGDAPIGECLEILFDTPQFGPHRYIDLFLQAMKETGTAKTRSNLFHRASAGVNLAKFFLYSLDIEGARAECGVFRGASALLLSRIARIKRPDFAGADYFLIDSFEGFGEENEHDKVLWQGDDSNTEFRTAFPAGGIGTSLETLQHTLREFPGVTIHKGWIPEVFAKLPETRWSFVYLDVDIYEPTLAGLEYFYPRMSPGGVIITDDFGHPMTPGVRKAWEQYCVANEVPYIVLDNLQAVILRQ